MFWHELKCLGMINLNTKYSVYVYVFMLRMHAKIANNSCVLTLSF